MKRTPHCDTSKFWHMIYLLHIFTHSENFISLTWVIKKFEFRRPHLRATSSFLYSQILSNFIWCLCLPTKKISCVWLKRLKSLNFGGLIWKGPFCLVSPKFHLFLILTYLKNFIGLALKVEKFEFWRAHLRGTPQSWHPKFLSGTSTFGYL